MNTIIKKIAIFSFCLIIQNGYSQLNWKLENEQKTKTTINEGDKESGEKYLLYNETVGHNGGKAPIIMKYGKRDWGLNIIWGSFGEKMNEQNYVNINRKPGLHGPLKTGEPIAIRFEGGGYLRYGNQKFGINLEWESSNTDKIPYQFAFYNESGEKGEEINTNTVLALCYKEKDFIIYCERPSGLNIGWESACQGGKQSTLQTVKNMVPAIKKGVKYSKWALTLL